MIGITLYWKTLNNQRICNLISVINNKNNNGNLAGQLCKLEHKS